MTKQTVRLETVGKWLNKQLKLPSLRSAEFDEGYDAALSDLQIQIDNWKVTR